MSNTVRVAGKLGKLPVKPPAERFAIKYVHQYAHEPLPAPSYPVDVTGGIGDEDWGMCGNGPDPACTTHPDGVGDCGYAGREHYKYAKAACYGETEQRESSNDLVAEYLGYDHGQDVGVNLADVLLSWYRAGKILAFAPVDHADPAAVDSAMQEFKGVYCGVGLTDDAQELFAEGQPWTVANGEQSDPMEGHCILKAKADGQGRDGYVTWGVLQEATSGWTAECLEEAWVVITSEDEAAKVDMPALLADILALHGTGGNGGPVPVPVPAAHEGLLQEVAKLVREIASSADRDIAEVVSFLHSHGL